MKRLGTLALLVGMAMVLLAPASLAAGGQYRPPEGCYKIEFEDGVKTWTNTDAPARVTVKAGRTSETYELAPGETVSHSTGKDLSHVIVCPTSTTTTAPPITTTTVPVVTTTTTPSTTTTSVDQCEAIDDCDRLPETGFELSWFAGLGALLMVAGLGLLGVSTRT